MHPEHHAHHEADASVADNTASPTAATVEPGASPDHTPTLASSAGDTVGSNRWYLSTAPIIRALVHLCVPMAAALVVSAVYNLINAGVVGSLHDTTLLAAITLGAPILGLIMAIGDLFGVGGGALPAPRRFGTRPSPSG
jgi:multidrug efflux pump